MTNSKVQTPKLTTNDKVRSTQTPKTGVMYIILLFFSFSFSNANVGSWQPFKGERWVLFVFSHNVKACKVIYF